MKNKRILVIEDDEWQAEQYQRILEKSGYKVDVAHYALSAIKQIDKHIPDVIILDILLTGVTSFTLLHELQSYNDTGLIPVIVCTNIANELTLEELMAYGVKQILDKTIMEPNDLLFALRVVLE